MRDHIVVVLEGIDTLVGSQLFWELPFIKVALAQCRNNHCMLCELVEVRRNVKWCKQGVVESQKFVVNLPLQWSCWHEVWGEELMVEI